ncbi:hypothetical protein ACFP1Z_07955 [Streptomyces gamaensis]|uniref:Bulb-type lectin domain-containing protein n=1 Tax=Streptomyces gamaensis TaxID=1763542 RepID=A0ABW0YU99_9ACTN
MADAVFPTGTSIVRNQALTNGRGDSVLRLQDDGNFVLYQDDKPTWQAEGVYPNGRAAVFAYDGNLVVLDENRRVIWESRTGAHENQGSTLAVQDDHNVVIYNPEGRPIWATGTNN